jgi:hypothetical protein
MGKLALLALRIVLATVLAGTLFVQVLMVTLLATDPEEGELADIRVPIVVIVVLGIVTIQVTLACVWRLLTMVRRGTVFSHAAFRYVDIVIGAAAGACLLTLGLAVTLVTLAPDNDAVPPGGVLLIAGVAVLVAGVALIVYVLRMLLAQAVARDAEAHHLRAELEDVI